MWAKISFEALYTMRCHPKSPRASDDILTHRVYSRGEYDLNVFPPSVGFTCHQTNARKQFLIRPQPAQIAIKALWVI